MAAPLTRAGRYQIVSELGRGSMGVVYQGFDPLIGRTVAIKTMRTEGLTPPEFEDFKARFQREAQAAGILNHPNIVTIYDFGEDTGILYLAMELLEGKSLQTIMEEEGILPVERVIPIYEQVCGALDHAHTRQIIHRDVKPANFMILPTGLVKVTDFGIAKMMMSGMTQAGQILGTPNYMSPEQVRGRHIDGRSDIFSLGVILYELVTGEKPFGGKNLTTVIYRIINENPISPRELDSTIHPGLSYVIQKALAKNPDERYQTGRELADDLKNYRNLGNAIGPSETVLLRVPPIVSTLPRTRQVTPVKPAPASPPMTAGELPLRRPIPGQAMPPIELQPRQSSTATWVLVILLLVVAAGGGYYYIAARKPFAPQPVQPAPQPQASPTTQASPEQSAPSSPQGNSATSLAAQSTDVSAGTERAGTTPVTGSTATGPLLGEAAPAGVQTANPQAGAPSTAPSEHGATAAEPRASPTPAAGGTRELQAPGSLVVSANVAGAQISIDGRTAPGWVTPFTMPGLVPGIHSVVVSKDGYNSAQRTVTVEAGRAENLSVELTVPSGEINIVTVPSGVDTLIDGQPAGKTPLQKPVRVGKHTFTLRWPGMEPYTSSFEIRYDGSIVSRRIDLSAATTALTGVVEVRTNPPGAAIQADGKPVGGTTPTSFRLAAGRHKITLSLAGYQTLEKEVDVAPDGMITVNEQLSP